VRRAGRLAALILLAALALAAPQGVLAQAAPTAASSAAVQGSQRTANGIDYAAWEATAKRAEEAIGTGRASNAALEQLRSELVEWRRQFLGGQEANSARIATVREQIAALGPAPANGATEPAEIANRRAELNAQLEELQAPALKAEEAYRRADGLIGEIDGLIRARQARELLRLGPSPLNPANWVEGWDKLSGSLRALVNEVSSDWRNDLRRAEFRNNLPAVLMFVLIGLVLMLRGRRWTVRLTSWLYERNRGQSRQVLAAVMSLSQVILPFIGLMALVAALRQSSLLGLRAGRMVDLIPEFGLIILAAAWLAGRVFPRQEVALPVLELPVDGRARARLAVVGLGLLVALRLPLEALASYENYSPAALAALRFPLIVGAGLLLFRMGRIMAAQGRGEDDTRPYRNSILRQLGRAVLAVAAIGPVLAAVGYSQAAVFLLFPTAATLGLLAVLALLQRFVTDLYVLAMGGREEARESLLPILLGFVVVLAALPVAALIWGARPADLTELWARVTEGVVVGETRISPGNFIAFAVIFVIGYSVTRLLQGALRNSVLPKTRIDPGGQHAIVAGTGYVGIALAAVVAITSAGIDLSSLAIVAGALSVGIGFGLQNIVSNFVSGIILLIERPVTEGDWIEVGGVMGTVRDISVRSTRIETFDRTDVIVPNADLISGSVTNWTKSSTMGRIILKVGVAYGTDTRRVEQILREVGEAHPLVMVNPAPLVVFQGFGADALDFELRVVLSDINFGLSVRTELNHEIARRFAEEGIEIPFAQRDIWLRNPEALRSGAAAPAAAPDPQPQNQPQARAQSPDFDRDDDDNDGEDPR
jgi:potassium efflux system protein